MLAPASDYCVAKAPNNAKPGCGLGARHIREDVLATASNYKEQVKHMARGHLAREFGWHMTCQLACVNLRLTRKTVGRGRGAGTCL